MPDDLTEQKREQLVRELADAPQGIRDAEMPPSPNPFGGQVGPDPADTALPVIDMSQVPVPGEGDDTSTGEEPDPEVFDAGGVDTPNTDGSTRTQ